MMPDAIRRRCRMPYDKLTGSNKRSSELLGQSTVLWVPHVLGKTLAAKHADRVGAERSLREDVVRTVAELVTDVEVASGEAGHRLERMVVE